MTRVDWTSGLDLDGAAGSLHFLFVKLKAGWGAVAEPQPRKGGRGEGGEGHGLRSQGGALRGEGLSAGKGGAHRTLSWGYLDPSGCAPHADFPTLPGTFPGTLVGTVAPPAPSLAIHRSTAQVARVGLSVGARLPQFLGLQGLEEEEARLPPSSPWRSSAPASLRSEPAHGSPRFQLAGAGALTEGGATAPAPHDPPTPRDPSDPALGAATEGFHSQESH